MDKPHGDAIMGLTHNASIVTDGLVFCLDAANRRSYSGSGTGWYDMSGNSNNGTLTNSPTFNSANNGSIVLDGLTNGSYVNVPNNTSLNISSAISLEAYIYPTKNSGTQNVICKSSLTQNSAYIYPRTDNGWSSSVFYLKPSNWVTLTATWPSINAWHHTIATYDGATMKIYINGQLASSKSQTGTITTNTNALSLGRQPGYSNEFYGGRIACARVYNRALSQAEITQNYNATRGRFL